MGVQVLVVRKRVGARMSDDMLWPVFLPTSWGDWGEQVMFAVTDEEWLSWSDDSYPIFMATVADRKETRCERPD